MDYIIRVQLENGQEKMFLCENVIDAACQSQKWATEQKSKMINAWLYKYYQTMKVG